MNYGAELLSQDIKDFINSENVVIDVRSSSEFEQGHIPGAINVPLLNNDQRREVGILYKKEGREAAVQKGFELAGPSFHEIIQEIKKLSAGSKCFLYCWRGGMRSEIVQWMVNISGIPAIRLEGGYKAFRTWVLEMLEQPINLIVLGGKTGSGKTEILHQLRKKKEQVIDLEGLASHKGSAFGSLGQLPQPTNQMFENLIAVNISILNLSNKIWIENESRSIGKCVLPNTLFDSIRRSDVVEVDPGYETRFSRIKREYGCFDHNLLVECTLKIKKRLGPNKLKIAVNFLEEGDFDNWLKIILEYYDKQYTFSGNLRDSETRFIKLDLSELNEIEYAEHLIKKTKNIFS